MDVVGRRNWFFGLSLLIIIPGMISMITQGFALGIDFAGGTEIQATFNQKTTAAAVQTAAAKIAPGAVVQAVSGADRTDSFIIRTGPLTTDKSQTFHTSFPAQFGGLKQQKDPSTNRLVDVFSLDIVGPVIAQESIFKALLSIAVASLLIVGYLWFRFGFKFGVCAISALLHDIFLLTGVFSILGKVFGLRLGEIDSLFVTAALTVVGFSVHNTIVIFDRIRENLRTSSRLTFPQTVNLSIVQSMARSVNTSVTVLLVLLALFLFGGDSIKGFVLALLVGILSGTYSSIFNAAPLLAVWRGLERA
ncbi:MAG: protein translocase subunit SecF [Candidatus Dormibacteria bacterium]